MVAKDLMYGRMRSRKIKNWEEKEELDNQECKLLNLGREEFMKMGLD